mgnify:FL=1
MHNDGISYRIFTVCNTILLILLSLLFAYPVLYVLFASLSDSNKLMGHMGLLLKPLDANLNSYRAVFKNPMILHGYGNTLFVVVMGLALSMVLTVLCAYVLSRKELALRRAFIFYVTFTMFFGGGLIPTYLTVKELGLNGTLWAIIIPGSLSVYNMIILRTSFESIPESLVESTMLDGASHLQILTRIILPLSLPVLMVIMLYYAVGLWNSWFGAMIYLRDRAKYPLQLILREILIQNDTSSMTRNVGMEDNASVSVTVQYAVIVVATVPILVIYPFVQKFFTKGVMIGAVKG